MARYCRSGAARCIGGAERINASPGFFKVPNCMILESCATEESRIYSLRYPTCPRVAADIITSLRGVSTVRCSGVVYSAPVLVLPLLLSSLV
jgi:hypothetical protein